MATDRDFNLSWQTPLGGPTRPPTAQEVAAARAGNPVPMFSRDLPVHVGPVRVDHQAVDVPSGEMRPPGEGRFSAVSYQASSPWPTVGRNTPTPAERIRADLAVVQTPVVARQALLTMKGETFTLAEEAAAERQIRFVAERNPHVAYADILQSARWAVEALRTTYPAELGPPPTPQPVPVVLPDGTPAVIVPEGGPRPTRPAGPPPPTPMERAAEAGITSAAPAPAQGFSEWVKGEQAMRAYLKATGQE